MMMSKLVSLFLELCLAVMVSSSVIKPFQEFDVPVCERESVCSEIYTAPSSSLSRSHMSSPLCKCPSGQFCPSEPGVQTMNIDTNRWFGLCRPVSDLPTCEPGDVAGEIQINQYSEKSSAKVLCNCPISQTVDLASQDAMQVVYQLTCKVSDNFLNKRARYGETSRHRGNGRFYFYKK